MGRRVGEVNAVAPEISKEKRRRWVIKACMAFLPGVEALFLEISLNGESTGNIVAIKAKIGLTGKHVGQGGIARVVRMAGVMLDLFFAPRSWDRLTPNESVNRRCQTQRNRIVGGYETTRVGIRPGTDLNRSRKGQGLGMIIEQIHRGRHSEMKIRVMIDVGPDVRVAGKLLDNVSVEFFAGIDDQPTPVVIREYALPEVQQVIEGVMVGVKQSQCDRDRWW